MKSKVINLFGNKAIVQNQGVKYSELLEQFITPFESDFDNVEFYEDVIDFALTAWNFGNIKLLLPEGEANNIINSIEDEDLDLDLINRMIAYKVSNFSEFTNFIVDFEVSEGDGDPVLTVVTQEEDDYLTDMAENMEDSHSEHDFEENYINRNAIILKPLQPFLDWFDNLYPDESDGMDESVTYLVSVDIENVETWLKKEFDKLFIRELEGWHTNKKEWPQMRTYKMFKEWFQVDLSTMVYDLEKEPVFKEG